MWDSKVTALSLCRLRLLFADLPSLFSSVQVSSLLFPRFVISSFLLLDQKLTPLFSPHSPSEIPLEDPQEDLLGTDLVITTRRNRRRGREEIRFGWDAMHGFHENDLVELLPRVTEFEGGTTSRRTLELFRLFYRRAHDLVDNTSTFSLSFNSRKNSVSC